MSIKVLSFQRELDWNGDKDEKVFRGSDDNLYSANEIEKLSVELWRADSSLGYILRAMSKAGIEAPRTEQVISAIKKRYDATTKGAPVVWSNSDCMSDASNAMRVNGFSTQEIENVMVQFKDLFDWTSTGEAAEYFHEYWKAR